MPKEVDPKNTTRAAAYALWMKAPNPMVTFFKTFDVTNLIKVSRKRSLKFNMLLDTVSEIYGTGRRKLSGQGLIRKQYGHRHFRHHRYGNRRSCWYEQRHF